MSECSILPSCWVSTKLGNLCEVKSGVGFPKKYQGKISGDYPVYKVRDVSRAVNQHKGRLEAADHYVTSDEAIELKGEIFRAGSTLFAKIGEAVKLNRRALVTHPCLADNNVMAVVPFQQESDNYLHYFLRTIDLSDVSRSTTVPSVRKGDIESLQVNLPPLAEQKVIADKLDALLAQVESIKARFDRIPQTLKRFRQSVLSAAVSGELIDTQPKGTVQLQSLVNIENGARKPMSASVRKNIQGDIPYYGATGIVDHLNDYTHEGRYLLVGEDGANLLSKSKDLAFIVEGKIWVNNHAHVLKELTGVHLDFVKVAINSLDLTPWITGSAQPKLTKKSLCSLPITNFSFEEQTEIVRRVDQLFAYTDRVEQQVNNALERVNNLTQSILAKAFRGELTEQWRQDNPDLISGDNSAEALLERIQAERAAMKPAKRSRKKTSA